MPITVQHGPDQSRYASVIAQSAKQTENYERMKQIAEFMQAVKQQNREYELGKKQNELTGRGQDITYDLGLKDVGLRNRGYDLQQENQNNNFFLGKEDVRIKDQGLTLQEQELAQQRYLAELAAKVQHPNGARQAGLFGDSGGRSFYQTEPNPPWARGVTGTT